LYLERHDVEGIFIMATTCDYCGQPIGTDGRVTLVPTPLPNGAVTDALDFHIECQRAFLNDAATALRGKGKRPTQAGGAS
jgi:hypothetical protein